MRRRTMLLGTLTMVLVLAWPAAGDAQQGTAAVRTVTAIGSSSVGVTPSDRKRNGAIRAAIAAAKAAGVAPALTDARARAQLIAQAAGATLGPIQSVDENIAAGPFFYYGQTEGTFGPGQYCGKVRRYVTRRDAQGRRRRVRRGSRFVCRFPRTVETRLAVTFAIQ